MGIEHCAEFATILDPNSIKLCVEAAYSRYLSRMDKPPGPMLQDYSEVIARHQVWILRGDHDAVDGVLVLIPRDDHMLLDNIAVHPDRQGAGLGGTLLRLADAEARRQGYDELRLYTHVTMTENIALYQALGWQIIGQGTEDGYERMFMRKPLGPGG